MRAIAFNTLSLIIISLILFSFLKTLNLGKGDNKMKTTNKKSHFINFFTIVVTTVILFGSSVFAQSVPAQLQAFTDGLFVDKDNGFAVSKQDNILMTKDGGRSWLATNISESYGSFNSIAVDQSLAIAVGGNGNIKVSYDGGLNWQNVETSFTSNLKNVHIFYNDQRTVIIFSEDGTDLVSNDDGRSFSEITREPDKVVKSISYLNELVGFCLTTQGKVLRTEDGGITFGEQLNSQELGGFNSISMANEYRGTVVGNDGQVYSTFDTWQTMYGPKNHFVLIRLNSVEYIDEFTAIVVGQDGLIFKTTDGGNDFSQIQSNVTTELNSLHMLKGSTKGLIVGDLGTILYTVDNGSTWVDYTTPSGIGDNPVNNNNGNVRNNLVPNSFDLAQNYPNPFNPSTKIKYQLPADANVSIQVYDMTGRSVANLVNGFQNAGSYEIEFKANNLSSGVYFYRITASSSSQNFSKTLRMVLNK